MKVTIKKLVSKYVNYMAQKQKRVKAPRLHSNKDANKHPFKPLPIQYLQSLEEQQRELQEYIEGILKLDLNYASDDRRVEMPVHHLVGLVDRLRAVTHLNRDLLVEVNGLRPYNVELMKIAKMTGESKDPFAAWETLALWQDAYEKQQKQNKAKVLAAAVEKTTYEPVGDVEDPMANSTPYVRALRYLQFARLIDEIPDGGMDNLFKRVLTTLTVTYCASKLPNGAWDSSSAVNVWYFIKDKPSMDFMLLSKLDEYLDHFLMEINFEAVKRFLNPMDPSLKLRADELKRYQWNPLSKGVDETTMQMTAYSTRKYFRESLIKNALDEIVDGHPRLPSDLATHLVKVGINNDDIENHRRSRRR